MPSPTDVSLIPELYSPMERAVLAAYLQIPDPRPDDLRGLDPTKPVPSRWSERSHGIGPQRSALDSTRMVENAVARICLESVDAQLPQWASISNGEVVLGRRTRRAPRRRRSLSPEHLFTINWADSGPGFSWPEAYYVTVLPGYDVSVVTASADCPDTTGYCDVAVGWFPGSEEDLVNTRESIQTHWWTLKSDGQERWAYLFDTGALDEEGAGEIADAVWGGEGTE